MSHKPIKFVRGGLHVKQVCGDCISVSLGEFNDPESEHVLTLNDVYLDDLVAAIRAYQQMSKR